MCGIGAVIGEKDTGKTLQSMLQRLDYRGYDSWGIATNKQTVKSVGEVPSGELGIKGDYGLGHCLAPSTRVVTSRGKVEKIEELDSSKVKSFDFDEYSETEESYNKYSHEAPDTVFEIKSSYSHFEATPEHKLFVAEEEEIKTKKVKDLTGDELIPSPSKIPHEPEDRPSFTDVEQTKKYKDLKFPDEPSRELLEIIGYHIGDGHINSGRTLRYKDADREILEEYNKNFKEVFNIKGNIHDRGGHYVLNVNSKYLADWFKENISDCLYKTGNEVIPEWVYSSSLDEVGGFVTGLFDAEGCVGEAARQVSITMTSKDVVEEMRYILLKKGILSTKYVTEREDEPNWSTAYKIQINNKESLEKFKRWAGFRSSKKAGKVDALLEEMSYKTHQHSSVYETQEHIDFPGPHNRGSILTDNRLKKILNEKDSEKYSEMLNSNVIWTRFEIEEKSPNYDFVYDLEVENTESFYAGGAVQHNSRWATHGEVTEANAHPHSDCEGDIQIVHNGIIENYEELKKRLQNKGHEFASETDSEVIAHLIQELDDRGGNEADFIQAIKEADQSLKGNYAVCVLNKKYESLYAIRHGSPLVIGKGSDSNYIGSDLYSFSPYTKKAYFMKDGDIVKVSKDEINLINGVIEFKDFEWEDEEKELEDYDHWMRKEIDEIPGAIRDYLDSMVGDQAQRLNKIADKLQNSEKVIFTASGTSYHASLLGVYYLQKAGIEAQTLIASEFENYERVDEDTTLVALSQSGETRDVLNAMNHARERGADIVSLVNVPHSTIQRASDLTLEIRAGQEICVAATKTFINQLVTLMSIAQRMGYDIDLSSISKDLESSIPELEQRAIEYSESYLKNSRKHDLEDVYIIGEGETYPVAREIALKLKEIPYIHAEGMMAGELKHGTLALIEKGTNVIALNSEENDLSSTVSELESRNANLFNLHDSTDTPMEMKASIYGFLASYHIAKEKDLPIDKPRHLAKSVTVE